MLGQCSTNQNSVFHSRHNKNYVNGLFQKVSTPPMDDTESGTQKFQDFQEAQ